MLRREKPRLLALSGLTLFVCYFYISQKVQFKYSRENAPNVLITGGCGFVGRHFTKRLCSMGYNVVIVDDLSSLSSIHPDKWPSHLKCEEEPGSISFIQMDCRDYFLTEMSVTEEFKLFIHLAAVVGGRAVIENNPILVAEDLSIDSEAFKWATRKQTGMKMVYFSSSAAYPVKLQNGDKRMLLAESLIDLLNDDKDISKPDLTYGWAKLTGEYLAILANKKHNLQVAVYRPMSGYGEDQHESYPFKAIVSRAFNRETPISIWSNATRDFIHIEDIVTCVLQTHESLTPMNPLNLATGIPTSFEELALLSAELMGNPGTKVKVLTSQPKGVDYRVGDNTLYKQNGCSVTISLKQGIIKTIEQMNTNL